MALKPLVKGLLATMVLGTVAAGAGAGYAWHKTEQIMLQPIQLEQPLELTIRAGQSVAGLYQQWAEQGVVRVESPLWLRLALKKQPHLADLKTGTYELTTDLTLAQALAFLIKGQEKQFHITLVEGGTAQQWLEQIKAHPKIDPTLHDVAALNAALGLQTGENKNIRNPSEGRLFPDTYAFTAGTTDLAILKRAFTRMETEIEQTWAQRQAKLPLKNSYEMLILASIIEKETGQASERPLVSSVFINRLNKGMRLQTDPTVIYGVGDAYQGRITRKHLDTWTPYNTYRINGLPPSPIANPSLAALQAAVAPDNSPYYYFVAKGDGSHQFSRTLREHNNAVNRYIRGK